MKAREHEQIVREIERRHATEIARIKAEAAAELARVRDYYQGEREDAEKLIDRLSETAARMESRMWRLYHALEAAGKEVTRELWDGPEEDPEPEESGARAPEAPSGAAAVSVPLAVGQTAVRTVGDWFARVTRQADGFAVEIGSTDQIARTTRKSYRRAPFAFRFANQQLEAVVRLFLTPEAAISDWRLEDQADDLRRLSVALAAAEDQNAAELGAPEPEPAEPPEAEEEDDGEDQIDPGMPGGGWHAGWR
jgi:hypothetical protein